MAFPSTFVDIQNAVIARLRLSPTGDLQKVKDWINQAYTQAVVTTECLQRRATMTLTASGAIYTLPSAIIRLKYAAIKATGQTQYSAPLEEVTVDDLLEWRRGSGAAMTSTPTHYCVVGLKQFELWPPPASADTMLVYYTYLPTALAADADVPVLEEPWNTRLLEYGALVEAADFLNHPNADTYRQLYDTWMARFMQHVNRRGGANVRQIPILWPRDYVPADPSTDVRFGN